MDARPSFTEQVNKNEYKNALLISIQFNEAASDVTEARTRLINLTWIIMGKVLTFAETFEF